MFYGPSFAGMARRRLWWRVCRQLRRNGRIGGVQISNITLVNRVKAMVKFVERTRNLFLWLYITAVDTQGSHTGRENPLSQKGPFILRRWLGGSNQLID